LPTFYFLFFLLFLFFFFILATLYDHWIIFVCQSEVFLIVEIIFSNSGLNIESSFQEYASSIALDKAVSLCFFEIFSFWYLKLSGFAIFIFFG